MNEDFKSISGQSLQAMLKQYGVNLTELAGQLHRSRSYFYEVFQHENVRLPLLVQISRCTGISFEPMLPPGTILSYKKMISQIETDSTSNTQLQSKYLELEEEYMNLLKRYNALLEKVLAEQGG